MLYQKMFVLIFMATSLMPGNTYSEKVFQTKCPVMGVEIDKKIFVDYKGSRIFFCCEGCIETFNSNPEKYLKNVTTSSINLQKNDIPSLNMGHEEKKTKKDKKKNNRGKTNADFTAMHNSMITGTNTHNHGFQNRRRQKGKKTLRSQTFCPVMGGNINKKVYADYKDLRVYFCCDGCVIKFNQTPNMFIRTLKKYGEKPEKIN